MNEVKNLVIDREITLEGNTVQVYRPEGSLPQKTVSNPAELISAEALLSRGSIEFELIPEFHQGIGRLTGAIEAAAKHLETCVNPSQIVVDVKNDTSSSPGGASLGVTKNQIFRLQQWKRRNKRLPRNLTIRVYEAGTGPENGLLWMVDDYQKLMKQI